MGYLKLLLYPFSWLYNAITAVRNYLFDIGHKQEFTFEANVIGIGNLTVGGTGKSPMVEYLIELLTNKYSLATLSRGYGRKTKGFMIAGSEDSASTIGDEPYQFFRKFPEVMVAVGEERAMAIPKIIAEGDPQIILMDDSYQHRYVKPSLNILLSDYSRPFYSDTVLPAGRLRESRKGAKRADLVIITKCPETLNDKEMNHIKNEVSTYTKSSVYFSKIVYCEPLNFVADNTDFIKTKVIAFAGLANNKIFKQYVSENYELVEFCSFPDHHKYSSKDLDQLTLKIEQEDTSSVSLITTEKDMVKLLSADLYKQASSLPLYFICIKHQFLKDGNVFDQTVFQSIKNYSNPAFS